MILITQIVAFYLVWGACVGGAALGYELEGTTIAIVLTLLGFYRPITQRGTAILKLWFLGVAADFLAYQLGAFHFSGQEITIAGYPCWMAVLWLAFACFYLEAMGWLATKPYLSALLGAVGGPFSYYGASRLNAIAVPSIAAYLMIAAEYLIVMVCWAISLRPGRQ